MHFSINCLAVIYSPTVIFAILREATSETYDPGSIFHHISFQSIFTLQSLLSIFIIKIPKILILLSLSDLTFASNREGIDNPLITSGASCWLFVQVFGDLCVVSYWIDTLVLKTEGNTYATLLHHPFLFKGKTNASSRGSKKDFWRRCRGDLRQVKPYQLPIINSLPLHYILRHLPLVFLSPTSKMIFEKICPFLRPSSVRLLRFLVCSFAATMSETGGVIIVGASLTVRIGGT